MLSGLKTIDVWFNNLTTGARWTVAFMFFTILTMIVLFIQDLTKKAPSYSKPQADLMNIYGYYLQKYLPQEGNMLAKNNILIERHASACKFFEQNELIEGWVGEVYSVSPGGGGVSFEVNIPFAGYREPKIKVIQSRINPELEGKVAILSIGESVEFSGRVFRSNDATLEDIANSAAKILNPSIKTEFLSCPYYRTDSMRDIKGGSFYIQFSSIKRVSN